MGKKLKDFSPTRVVNDKVSKGDFIAESKSQNIKNSKVKKRTIQEVESIKKEEFNDENTERDFKRLANTIPQPLADQGELIEKSGSLGNKEEKKFHQQINYEKLFIFARSGKQFAVPLHNVIEVIRDFGEIGEKPLLSNSCKGSINYKGKLIPVFETNFLTNNLLNDEGFKAPEQKKLSLLRVLIDDLEVSFTMDRHVDVVSDTNIATHNIEPQFEHKGELSYIKQTIGFRDSSVSVIFLEKIWLDLKENNSRQTVLDPSNEQFKTEFDTLKVDYREYIYAKIFDYHFIVDIENVLEIIEGYDVTRIHDSRNFVRGLINLRGQVIACVDISTDLGREKLIIDERNKYIVLNHNTYDFALCVSEVIGIRSYPPASFIPAENVLSAETSSLFSGVSEQDSNTLLVLSVDRIVASPKLATYKIEVRE